MTRRRVLASRNFIFRAPGGPSILEPPPGASGSGLDQSGRLGLGHLDLVLVDLDLDGGVQVARGRDGEVEGDDLDALAAMVLDVALQGGVAVEQYPRLHP